MSDHEELVDLLRNSITNMDDGAGSDLSMAGPMGDTWVQVEGNLDIQHLASDILHHQQGTISAVLVELSNAIQERGNQYLTTMQQIAEGKVEGGNDDIIRYGAYGSQASTIATFIRNWKPEGRS